MSWDHVVGTGSGYANGSGLVTRHRQDIYVARVEDDATSECAGRQHGRVAGRIGRTESRYALQAARLGPRLKELRLQKGYTQQELANRAEIAISTLRKIEAATVVEPGYFTILSLLRALGVKAEDLSV